MDVLNLGGIITAIRVPDASGTIGNVVLGFDHPASYLGKHPFFGAIIGRFANRIGNSQFVLNGTRYALDANQGRHQLHGGDHGFHTRFWDVSVLGADAIRLTYRSLDGEAGFPGNLRVEVLYRLGEHRTLHIHYHAETDQPTHVNLTNHSYFNLSGNPSNTIHDHILTVNADRFTPVDADQIPTGIILDVSETPMDFRRPRVIDLELDHNFVIQPSDEPLQRAAFVLHPASGRTLEVFTTEPGVQVYSGKHLDAPHTGFCLETQHFPDSPNQPTFPSTILVPGKPFTSTTIYKFG